MSFDPQIPYNELPLLPPAKELETKEVLRATIIASRALAKLNGSIKRIPNPNILLNSIVLQEAKSSSEIENILTTNDDLFKALISKNELALNQNTKEVLHYQEALWHGYQQLLQRPFLSTNLFVEIVQIIKKINFNIRKTSGTRVANSQGESIYTQPEGESIIRDKLDNLEKFINDMDDGLDPLIKLAVQHYQFEAIHPFYEGNGRTGRIINILFLVEHNLLDLPILFLSKYIIDNKNDYYKKLRAVAELEDWAGWILFMIKGIEQMSLYTQNKIDKIVDFIEEDTEYIKLNFPRIYSKEFIEILYSQPYSKIRFFEDAGLVKKETASKYLSELESVGLFEGFKFGRETLYVNKKLFTLLKE